MKRKGQQRGGQKKPICLSTVRKTSIQWLTDRWSCIAWMDIFNNQHDCSSQWKAMKKLCVLLKASSREAIWRSRGRKNYFFPVNILLSPACSIQSYLSWLHRIPKPFFKIFILLHTFLKTALRKISSSLKYCGIFQKNVFFFSPWMNNNSSMSLKESSQQGKVILRKGLYQQRFRHY